MKTNNLRKLDALVAEKVFGKKHLTHCEGCDKEFNGFIEHCDWACARCDYQYGYDPTCPHYTTDIAAAWEVVEKLGKDGRDFRLDYDCVRPSFCAMFTCNKLTEMYTTEEETAPLAVCLAALKATGYEGETE